MSSPREQKQETMARLLGIQDWRVLAQQGVVVRLFIGRCRFVTSLSLEDLGMQQIDQRARQAVRSTIVLGAKRLLPEKYLSLLARTENQARRLLINSAFLLHVASPPLYFVPMTAYTQFAPRIADFQQRYFALRDEIVAQYDAIVDQMLTEYAVVAEQTYQRMQNINSEGWQEEKAAFITTYCEQIRACIPSPSRIMESFHFDILLSDPLQILEVDLGQLNLALPRPRPSRFKEFEQMRSDLRLQVQEREKETIDTFLTSILTQLRSTIALVLSDILASIERRQHAKFPKSALKTLAKLIRQIESLQFYDDQQLTAFLKELKSIIRQPNEQRDRSLPQIQETLEEIVSATRRTLLDLGVEERRSPRQEAPPVKPEIFSTRGVTREERDQLLVEVSMQGKQGRQARNSAEETLTSWMDILPATKESRRDSRPL